MPPTIPIVFMSLLPLKGRTVAGIFAQLRPHHSEDQSVRISALFSRCRNGRQQFALTATCENAAGWQFDARESGEEQVPMAEIPV
jgi:hypothetical protein